MFGVTKPPLRVKNALELAVHVIAGQRSCPVASLGGRSWLFLLASFSRRSGRAYRQLLWWYLGNENTPPHSTECTFIAMILKIEANAEHVVYQQLQIGDSSVRNMY
jgi:hypothetical protein